ncbi:MAG: 4Fe-4S dicluster domain-containing protein [Actinobacteria bacterium]|nr:MAG: 4Fe-4S dicluster domain-containing protein [Actinomycetota bacterium]
MAWDAGILKGLSIAFKNLVRGPITVQYPDERVELPSRARWAVIPLMDEAGAPKCTACQACVRACPDGVLGLRSTTRPDKTKHIDGFFYEVGACMLCGLCVEACPFSALAMGDDYELATTDTAALTCTLLADVDAASGKRAEPAAPPPDAATGEVADGEPEGACAGAPSAPSTSDEGRGAAALEEASDG